MVRPSVMAALFDCAIQDESLSTACRSGGFAEKGDHLTVDANEFEEAIPFAEIRLPAKNLL